MDEQINNYGNLKFKDQIKTLNNLLNEIINNSNDYIVISNYILKIWNVSKPEVKIAKATDLIEELLNCIENIQRNVFNSITIPSNSRYEFYAPDGRIIDILEIIYNQMSLEQQNSIFSEINKKMKDRYMASISLYSVSSDEFKEKMWNEIFF